MRLGRVSWGMLALVAVLVVYPTIPAIMAYRGLVEVVRDEQAATPIELSHLAVDATEYLVTLATGIVGLVALLLRGRGSDLRNSLGHRQKRLLAFGIAFCGLSLWSGFVTQHVILWNAAAETAKEGLDLVLWLHLVQVTELATGVGLVGGAFAWNLLPRPSTPAT